MFTLSLLQPIRVTLVQLHLRPVQHMDSLQSELTIAVTFIVSGVGVLASVPAHAAHSLTACVHVYAGIFNPCKYRP